MPDVKVYIYEVTAISNNEHKKIRVDLYLLLIDLGIFFSFTKTSVIGWWLSSIQSKSFPVHVTNYMYM